MTKIKDPSLPVPPPELRLRGGAVAKWQIEQLLEANKQLKAGQDDITLSGDLSVSGVTTPPEAVAAEAPEAYNYSADPLAWIDEDVYEVYFVGRIYGVRGRRQMSDLRGVQEKTYFNAERTAQWVSCPFDYTSPDPDYQRQLQILNKMWWMFTLGREFAEEVYSGFDPLPERVVISAADYNGRDMRGRPMGKKTRASNDPLREYTRWVLQTNPKTMWLNGDAGKYIEKGFIQKGCPNPYGHGVQVDEPKGRAAGHMTPDQFAGGVSQ